MANIEKNLLKNAETKLGELLAENNLVYSFKTAAYPITLTVSQNLDPEAQMELYDTAPGDVSDRDSRLIIPDELLSKIKNNAKKMHYLYLQAFHRDRCESDE